MIVHFLYIILYIRVLQILPILQIDRYPLEQPVRDQPGQQSECIIEQSFIRTLFRKSPQPTYLGTHSVRPLWFARHELQIEPHAEYFLLSLFPFLAWERDLIWGILCLDTQLYNAYYCTLFGYIWYLSTCISKSTVAHTLMICNIFNAWIQFTVWIYTVEYIYLCEFGFMFLSRVYLC